jgi:serine/threonine protein kinase
MSSRDEVLLGQKLLARYDLKTIMHASSTTTRYLAVDLRLGCAVEIDVARSNARAVVNAFHARIKVPCTIGHPSIPTPRDAGYLDDGRPFIVWRPLAKESLMERVTLAGPLETADLVNLGVELLSAVSVAHEGGVVHGGLAPNAIRVCIDHGILVHAAISGFGGAQRSRDVAYAAPESIGGPPTKAADIYACGAILYFAATGLPPFRSQRELALPLALRRDLPQRIAHVLLQALARDPDQRFTTAVEMLGALSAARAELMLTRRIGIVPAENPDEDPTQPMTTVRVTKAPERSRVLPP